MSPRTNARHKKIVQRAPLNRSERLSGTRRCPGKTIIYLVQNPDIEQQGKQAACSFGKTPLPIVGGFLGLTWCRPIQRDAVNHRSTQGRRGVDPALRSTWGRPGVQLRSTWVAQVDPCVHAVPPPPSRALRGARRSRTIRGFLPSTTFDGCDRVGIKSITGDVRLPAA